MDGTAYPDDLGTHFRTGFSRGSEPRVTIPRVKNQGTLAGTPWNIANSDSHSDSIISATPLLDLSKWAAGPRFRRNLHKSQPCPNFWNISRNLDNWPGEVPEFLEIFQKFGQAHSGTIFARKSTISLAGPGFAKVQQGGRRE